MRTRTIYLDTNVLYSMNSPHSAFRDVLMVAAERGIPVCAPEVAVKEVVAVASRDADAYWKKMTTAAAKLAQLLGSSPLPIERKRALIGDVGKHQQELLRSLAVNQAATPTDLDINDLIDQAVQHVTPFREGDKGFRDAVLLETIVAHMQEQEFRCGMLLTKDSDFSQEGVNYRLRKLDIELVVARTAEDALSILDEELDAEAKKWVYQKERAIRAFLESRIEEVMGFVRDNIEVREDFFTGQGLYGALAQEEPSLPAGSSVEEVVACRPKRVVNVTYLPGASNTEGEEIVDAAWVDVLTEFDVRGTKLDGIGLLSSRCFRARPDRPFELVADKVPLRSSRFDETVKKDVIIRVEVRGTPEAYTGLSMSTRLIEE